MQLLVIDDHALFREGLAHVLNQLGQDITIFESQDATTALALLSRHADLDLVLLDLNLPGPHCDGFALLTQITTDFPTLPVVIVSASTHRADMQRALEAGAMGYICKASTSAVMLNALKLVMEGSVYVPAELVQPAREQPITLTPRQREVLSLLLQGCSNQDIAERLSLAEATVKMHVTAIFKALGVTNRTQAALAARDMRL